ASWTPRKLSKPKTRLRSSCGSVIITRTLRPERRGWCARALPLLGGLRNLLHELRFHLALPEFGVQSALVEQLLVRAALRDPALVQHDTLVGIDDGGQAVGDHVRRAALRSLVERLLELLLG